jgi:uncharacterized protein YbaR (Trm112 family)
MKITEEAKIILLEAIASNKADCLLVSQQTTCCGTSLAFSLANLKEGEASELIDGIPVFLEEAVRELVGKVTIQAENGQLFVHDENAAACDC